MTTLLQHVKAELRRAGLYDEDADYEGQVAPCIEGMLGSLVAYGHSGGSLEYTLEVFDKVARHMPLLPLTGEDDEWETPEGAGGQIQVNRRCTQVFKDDEMAWDVRQGRKPITFPYSA